MSDAQTTFSILPRDMRESAFVQCFGGVYEHTPSIAATTWQGQLDESHDSVDGLARALALRVDQFDREQKLDLINAHPDLAGRAAVAGELTAESSAEQSGAGIDQCSAEEFARFQDLNGRYKEKFGFIFIMAVKGSDRYEILQAFERRLQNTAEAEFNRAIQEIHKIAHLRLRAIAAEQFAESGRGQGDDR